MIHTDYSSIRVFSTQNGWIVVPDAYNDVTRTSEAHVYVSPEVLGAAIEDWARERRNKQQRLQK